MAAKPKLTPEQWAEVRKAWENDPRKAFPWLVKELGLDVSAEAIRQRSKAEGWEKAKNQSLANKKPSLRNEKTKLGKTPKNKPKTPASKTVKVDTKSITKALIESGESGGKGNKGGRPTKYRDEYANQAYKLCLLGYTDKELAEFFGVEEQTINNWKLDHKEFFESLRSGKDVADAEVVASFYKRAKGFCHPAVHVSNFMGEITLTEIYKYYPPDVKAGAIWLNNRQPHKWRSKVEVKEEININLFPPKDELDAIYASALREAEERERKLIGRRERIGVVIEQYDDITDD